MARRLAKDWLKRMGATKQEIKLARKLVRAAAPDMLVPGEPVEEVLDFEIHDVLRILIGERKKQTVKLVPPGAVEFGVELDEDRAFACMTLRTDKQNLELHFDREELSRLVTTLQHMLPMMIEAPLDQERAHV